MGSGKPPLILASGSPRRKALLEALGYPIRVAVPGVEEEGLPLPPKALAQALCSPEVKAYIDETYDGAVVAVF